MNTKMELDLPPSSQIREYRLKSSFRIFGSIMIGAILLIALLLLLSPVVPIIKTKSAFDAIGGVALSLALAWGIYYLMNLYRLVTSPQGIEYRCPEYTIVATWDELQGISNQNQIFPFTGEVLIAPYSKTRARWWLRWYANIVNSLIPISLFAQNWRESELGEDIKRYAPHLFKQQADVIKPYPPISPDE